MRSLTSGRGRLARGLTLSGACLVVPSAAHGLAGGGIPQVGPLVFVVVLLSVACVAMAERRLSPGGIAALMFASQPVFHVLMTLSAHGHGSATVSIAMVAGHMAAAGALTVLLAGGEAVLWSMAALSSAVLMRHVRILLSMDVPYLHRPLPSIAAVTAHPYVLTIIRAAPRRGPPLLSRT